VPVLVTTLGRSLEHYDCEILNLFVSDYHSDIKEASGVGTSMMALQANTAVYILLE
jgi:hypothetical protein